MTSGTISIVTTLAMATVIRTQANRTVGTSTEAATQISGPPRLPAKCLARGLPTSPDPENHSASRIPILGSDAIKLGDEDHLAALTSHHGSGKGTSGHQEIFEDLSPSNHHSSDDHGGVPGHDRHDISHGLHDLMV